MAAAAPAIAARAAARSRFGRFEVERIMGEGAQGTVYLARDPELDRMVAIKALQAGRAHPAPMVDSLRTEARMVSRLQHLNVVTLFDAGEEAGMPYLVFEYVEGQTLSDALAERGALPVPEAVELGCQLLDGISAAHRKGIVHLDMKPANVLLDAHGVPRIADFGIAQWNIAEASAGEDLIGTPRYMCPEYVARHIVGPHNDTYAIALMLHEMLTGAPAVSGHSLPAILQAVLDAPVAPPSQFNPSVPAKLDQVLMRALAKDPAERFPDALELRRALRACVQPIATQQPASAGGALEFLLRRIRHKSDFPALTQTLSTINRIASSEEEGAASLANEVLKDYALTNKLLRVVNTAFYGQFGGTIATVSRAVMVLGFDAIRNIAITLVLFDHLRDRDQATRLREELAGSMMSGLLARRLSMAAGVTDPEEAFVSAMFHNLGRMLVIYYFREEADEIALVMQSHDLPERDAARVVLGASFDELAVAVARSWNFPDRLVHSMRPMDGARIRRPDTERDRLRTVSCLASDLFEVAAGTPAEERDGQLQRLFERYSPGLRLASERGLRTALEHSLVEMRSDPFTSVAMPRARGLMERVRRWTGKEEAERTLAGEPAGAGAVADITQILPGPLGPAATPPPRAQPEFEAGEPATEVPAAPGEILSGGIQDITNALVENYDLTNVLRMIIETMYRAMRFGRILLALADPEGGTLSGRHGFGPEVERFARAFRFRPEDATDVIGLAAMRGLDVLIADSEAENIRARIPSWLRQAGGATAFVLLPISIDQKPCGLIYGELAAGSGGSIPERELRLLKTLRNQAVLAIRQKRQLPAPPR